MKNSNVYCTVLCTVKYCKVGSVMNGIVMYCEEFNNGEDVNIFDKVCQP